MDSDSRADVEVLRTELKNPAAEARRFAVEAAGAAKPDIETVRLLERVAISDADETVRRAALQALAAGQFAALQRSLPAASPNARQFMLAEIHTLEQDGLLTSAQAQIIAGRYAPFDSQAAKASAAPERPPGPAPSLSQLLLSETSVKIALYLGAFFVVAAAFILAALIEVARLPILGICAILFLGAALGLSKRLPAASFVLYAVGALMIPIFASVLADQLTLIGRQLDFYKAGTGFITGAVLSLGMRSYRSRLFSILAYLSFFIATAILGDALSASDEAVSLLAAAANFAGVFAAQRIGRWGGRKFFWPLFLVVQVCQAWIWLMSLTGLLFGTGGFSSPQGTSWLWAGALWGLLALFYLYSDRLAERFERWLPFALPAAVAAMVFPLLLLEWFEPGAHLLSAAAWAWGALLIAAAEFLKTENSLRLKIYPAALSGAAALLFLFAWVEETANEFTWAAILAAAGAFLLLAALAARRMRWALWTAALLFACLAYLSALMLPEIQKLRLLPTMALLPPALALLGLEFGLRRRGASRQAFLPPLILGATSGALLLWIGTVQAFEAPNQTGSALLVFSIFLLGEALLDRRPWIGYFALTGFALALIAFMTAARSDQRAAALIGLAAAYYLIGLALGRWAPPLAEAHPKEPAPESGETPKPRKWSLPGWAGVLQSSGLILGGMVSLSAPLYSSPLLIAAVALVASLFAFEAYRHDWIWLGYPTIVLYFVAYALALQELEIHQPQVYSIAAALLGILMYHLLARRRQQLAALLTGLLAQMILLSTTYIQMVSASDFKFFFIIFFQALALLIYGLVVRSRSFVFTPLIALVISVVTVALTVLSGLPTALIIGCTGILLLLLGILALVLRERLSQAADRWASRLEMP